MGFYNRKPFFQTWLLGMHQDMNTKPTEWVPATVPGAVQLDWGQAHNYPSYTYSDNYKAYLWMENAFWTYKTQLDYPELENGQRLFFVCGGVDYRFQIGVGESLLHDQEGMFTPVELELTGLAKSGDELWVRIYPIPKTFEPEPDLDTQWRLLKRQADHSCKPAVSYGWDFHPRLVPLGIWQDTYLEVRPADFIANAVLDYRMNETCDQADIRVQVELSGVPGGKLVWKLEDSAGKMVMSQEMQAKAGHSDFQAGLANPELWWPHDQGVPELYTSRILLYDIYGKQTDSYQQKVGFRRVRLVTNQDAWNHPAIYPKSRSHAPMTLEINGRAIFAKGSNWLSPQIFPGLLNRQTYEVQLGMVKQANMNILRCWGGCPVMKQSFFDICDELGVMIWQEFPLACNDYPDDPAYLKVLDQESRSIVLGLKSHPSLVMWCGGNELFNNWSGMDEQSLPLRLLDSNCYLLDPETPYIMTSPLDGVAHGPYHFIDWSTDIETWQIVQDSNHTAYCEFSTGGSLRSVDELRKIIPEDELFPITPSKSWVAHRAMNSDGKALHLSIKNILTYFGESASLDEVVERSQFLAAAGVQGVFEEVRRKKMKASMAINWCLNEPWPNAAGCGNLITWYNTPVPALFATAEALRPALASAQIRKFKWLVGEVFNPELWILSDAPSPTPPGRVEAWLRMGEREIFLLEWKYPELPPATNLAGPRIQFVLPAEPVERFQLELRLPGCPQMNSTYTLLIGTPDHSDQPYHTKKN
jgi:beta-mannosidase